MARYVALLRGINVGGKNLIKMADLKTCFEEGGFENVSTYIASGNVIFESPERSAAKLTTKIEGLLKAAFKPYEPMVIVRSKAQLRTIVEKAPKGFGEKPSKYRSDVLFLKAPLSAAATLKTIPTREGVDQAYAGPGVLYFSRLTAKATSSRLGRLVELPVYKSITIRSWSTTVKLADLLQNS